MISLMCCDSRLSTAALIVYTCVWIPFLELKTALLRLLGFVFPWLHQPEESCQQVNVCLPVARFEDVKAVSNGSRGETGEDLNGTDAEEVCSICLVEFEMEDVVSQLQGCKHVFHMKCIEKWVDRDQFTCPLCRSFLFANASPSCAKCGITPHASSHLVSSWLSF